MERRTAKAQRGIATAYLSRAEQRQGTAGFGYGCELNGKGNALLGTVSMSEAKVGRGTERPSNGNDMQRRVNAEITQTNADLTQRQGKAGQHSAMEQRCNGGAERGLEVRWRRL